ncbi:flavin reductase family protein [Pseudoroseicyclus sp. CXY001]|uniref:flavin reductase family protein n=1 Tax=Pseudoroseicyclus sp. CXY001 TaxID=3242492 RepID=UPI00358DD473
MSAAPDDPGQGPGHTFVDPAEGRFRRAFLNELVAPRPIGWISTLDGAGRANLAPFSHFNVASSAPPIVMFSCNTPEDREQKDTLANVLETGEFVVNMASFGQKEAMIESSAPLPAGTDEFAAAGLTKLASRKVAAPRVAGAPAHMECRLWHVLHIKATTEVESDSHVVFGKVVGIHMRADLIDAQGRFKTVEAMPVARLGGIQYLSTTDIFELPPKFKRRS